MEPLSGFFNVSLCFFQVVRPFRRHFGLTFFFQRFRRDLSFIFLHHYWHYISNPQHVVGARGCIAVGNQVGGSALDCVVTFILTRNWTPSTIAGHKGVRTVFCCDEAENRPRRVCGRVSTSFFFFTTFELVSLKIDMYSWTFSSFRKTEDFLTTFELVFLKIDMNSWTLPSS